MSAPGTSLRPRSQADLAGPSRWVPGIEDPAPLPSRLAAPRPHRRAGAHHHAGAGRHRLRRGLGRARHLRPLRHHRPAAGLCAVRAEPHPGARAGLVAGADHPRPSCCRCPAAIRCARWRWPARWRWSPGLVCILAGVAAAGLHHRAAVQADPLRLHERHRAHGADQPAAQAVRLLDRGDGPLRSLWAIGQAVVRRRDQLDGLRCRRRRRSRSSCCSRAASACPAC